MKISLPFGRSSRRDDGFTLIEVMVALVVLVLGVLGAAAMTLTALRDGKQSGLRSQASALAYELSDVMRANRSDNTIDPNFESVFTGTPPTGGVANCWTTSCIPSDMAKNDYFEWSSKLQNPQIGLPNGASKVCRDSTNLDTSTDTIAANSFATCDGSANSPIVVKLRWDEKINYARGQTTTTAIATRYMFVPIQPYF